MISCPFLKHAEASYFNAFSGQLRLSTWINKARMRYSMTSFPTLQSINSLVNDAKYKSLVRLLIPQIVKFMRSLMLWWSDCKILNLANIWDSYFAALEVLILNGSRIAETKRVSADLF